MDNVMKTVTYTAVVPDIASKDSMASQDTRFVQPAPIRQPSADVPRHTMATNWVRLLALLMATVALTVSGARAKPQASPKSGLRAANQRINWQKQNWETQNFRKPAAHLIGKRPSQRNTLKWISETGVAFARKIKHPLSTTLVIPRKGLYYIYCQVSFEGLAADLTLLSQVVTWNVSNNDNATLILGTESITGPPLPTQMWHANLNLGGLANLEKGQKLYVHVSHPEHVDYTEGKTFFGIVMVS
ncbi:lymphotoxin-beta-like [Leptodactylus fuscus]